MGNGDNSVRLMDKGSGGCRKEQLTYVADTQGTRQVRVDESVLWREKDSQVATRGAGGTAGAFFHLRDTAREVRAGQVLAGDVTILGGGKYGQLSNTDHPTQQSSKVL